MTLADVDELKSALSDAEDDIAAAKTDLESANRLVHEMVDVLGLDAVDVEFIKQGLDPLNSGDARRGLLRALERAGWTRRARS